MAHSLKVECKVLIKSYGIWGAPFLLLIGGWLGVSSFILDMGTRVGISEEEVQFLMVLKEIFNSEIFSMALPIGCVWGATTSFLDDLQSRIIWYRFVRSDKKQYYCSKIIIAVVSGVSIVFIGCLGLIISCLVVYFPTAQEQGILLQYWLGEILHILKHCILLMVCGGFWAICGAIFSVLTNSKYMAYAAPFIIYYVCGNLVDSYLPKVYLLNLKEWQSLQRIDFWLSITVVIGLSVLVSYLYYRMMERRVKNG